MESFGKEMFSGQPTDLQWGASNPQASSPLQVPSVTYSS